MIIVLTKTRKDGQKLKNKLMKLSVNFSSIKSFIKEDIRLNPERYKNTSVIFSTWFMPSFSEDEIQKFFPSLKAVFYAAGTVKYFAQPFLNQGVRIFSAVKANAIPVAEFVTAQIILANKGYFQSQKDYKKPFWRLSFNKARNYTFQKKGNYNAKIGIIGCGSVGSMIVELLKPFKLDVYIYDPFLSEKRIQELGVERSNLNKIFADCDVISNHLPDIAETKGMLNLKLFSLMQEHATFINTGRGTQVVEKDLAKVMRKKPKACALLDVTTKEPIWPWSSLLRKKNVFITPHIAGSQSNEYERMVQYMVTAYANFMAGINDDNEITATGLHKQA